MPRGDCFIEAIKNLVEFVGEGDEVVLVHGLPIGRGRENLGQRFWHAWVEVADGDRWWVVDTSSGLDVHVPREEFYALGQIEERNVWRYDYDEARELLTETHRHAGPWIDGWKEMGL